MPVAIPVITYEVPANQAVATLREEKLQLERDLNAVRDAILAEIENAQIKAYGADSNPPRPPGSRYERTFTLQSASETEVTGRQLPNISGVWRVNETIARYGSKVLGSRAEQARIHRGRWKTRTEVEREVQAKVPAIVEEHLPR